MLGDDEAYEGEAEELGWKRSNKTKAEMLAALQNKNVGYETCLERAGPRSSSLRGSCTRSDSSRTGGARLEAVLEDRDE